jgi:chemotaxis protein CheD
MTPAAADPPQAGLPARLRVYLHPGQVFAAREPTEVTTILGSCVSVCLWDSRLKVGGLNHFLLPLPPSGAPSPRFAEAAILILVERMRDLGCRPALLQAKMFGGANRLDMRTAGLKGLGLQNVDVARSVLAGLHIPIVAEDVGGKAAAKLVFHTDDGACLVRRL